MSEEDRSTTLSKLESHLGLSFTNKTLLDQAFTHSSYTYESADKTLVDNERMEFLGDAVLKIVVSEYLFNKFPQKNEGDLTKIRAFVVSDNSFAKISRNIDLGEYLLLGNNEKRTGGKSRKSNLANVFEALVGAIFLDAGLGKARDFVMELLAPEIEKVSRAGFTLDYKSTLQETVQKKKWPLPIYHVIKESGPKHRRVFWIEVKVKGKVLGQGRGGTKKDAEQRAAAIALRNLRGTEREPKKDHGQKGGMRGIFQQVRKIISSSKNHPVKHQDKP